MKLLTIVLTLAAVAACKPDAALEPATQQIVGTDVLVSLGDSVSLGNTGLQVAFREVTEDSRCPIDAVCIWEGNAQIAIDASSATRAQRGLLNTTHGAKQLVFSGYLIELVELLPAPQSNQPNPQYQATLRWRFLPD